MKFRDTLDGRIHPPHSLECRGVCASNQDILAAALLTKHGPNNSRDLLRRLAFAKNHFGVTLTQRAVMIHLGETQVFEGQMLQADNGLFRRQRAKTYEVHELVEFAFVHEVCKLAASLGLAFAHKLSQRLIVRVNAPLCNETFADYGAPRGRHFPEVIAGSLSVTGVYTTRAAKDG